MKFRYVAQIFWGTFFVVTLTNHSSFAAPDNDNFSESIPLTGSSGQTTGNNINATFETGEPDHAETDGGASVWWTWTAPTDGTVAFTTFGSEFDTILASYTGNQITELTPIAANDDSSDIQNNSEIQSKIVFKATAGTVYRIAVDGYPGATGEIILNWEYALPPTNDVFLSPVPLSGQHGTITGKNTFATAETGEPVPFDTPGEASVWWSWTAPSSAEVTFTTLGSNFDTLLAAYTGTQIEELTLVAANDDISDSQAYSQIRFKASAGTTYRLVVDGFGGDRGDIVLNWNATSKIPLGALLLLLNPETPE
nr:hypothetical protein [uncultured Desulfobulbus sp.]